MVDKQRITRAAMGLRGGDVQRRLNRRMKAYFALIVILGLAYVWGGDGGAPAVQRSDHSLDPVDVPSSAPEVPLARIDPTRLANVADRTPAEQSQLEPDALHHLLKQAGRLVYGDLPKLGLVAGDWEELVRHGDRLRGQPVWTLGTLDWVAQEMVDGYLQVRGEATDREGRPWAFLVERQPFDLVTGDVVKLAGFFFKDYQLPRPDGSQVLAPLIVGDELLRSAWPIEPVTELTSADIEDIRDGTIAQASAPLDSPEFWKLLSYARNASEKRLDPSGQGYPEVLPSQLLSRPWDYRAQPVRITGVVYYLTETALGPRGENPLGIPFGWHIWISDNRAGAAGTVLGISLERPEGLEEGQIVELDGLFFRRWSFENKHNQPHMASVVMVRDVHRFVPAEDEFTPMLVRIVAGLAATVALLIALGQWRERQARKGARSRRMRRHKGNVARPGLLSDASNDTTDGRPAHDAPRADPNEP